MGTWKKPSTRLANPSPLQSMQEVLSHTTRRESTNDPECVEGKLNHAILVVGYNKTAPEPYWIVKNSWGKNWGQDGYIHMKMGENNCGLASRPVYPILDIFM